MQVPIHGPDQVWSDRKEAAKWLGLGTDEFEGECKRYPHLLPARRIGKADHWHYADLGIYAHLRAAGRCGSPEDQADDESEKKR